MKGYYVARPTRPKGKSQWYNMEDSCYRSEYNDAHSIISVCATSYQIKENLREIKENLREILS